MTRRVIKNADGSELVVFEGKLQYASKASLESALLNRGILQINEEGETIYAEGTHEVVHLGHIVLEPATDELEAVLSDKYHADIMVDGEFSFGANEVVIADGQPSSHSFA